MPCLRDKPYNEVVQRKGGESKIILKWRSVKRLIPKKEVIWSHNVRNGSLIGPKEWTS